MLAHSCSQLTTGRGRLLRPSPSVLPAQLAASAARARLANGLTGLLLSEVVQLLLARAGPRNDEFSDLLEAAGPVACATHGGGFSRRPTDATALSSAKNSTIWLYHACGLGCLHRVVVDEAVTRFKRKRAIIPTRGRSPAVLRLLEERSLRASVG